MKEHPNILIKAHGTAVGLPSDDDMGNSEVGHNAIGAGQIYAQGAKLVTEAIKAEKYSEPKDGEKYVRIVFLKIQLYILSAFSATEMFILILII